MGFWGDAGRDLAEMARNPRQWWHNATHTPCPVCAERISVGHEMQVHKLRHGPIAWRTAISREQS